MTTKTLLLLPGDDIGVETMAEVERLIAFFNSRKNGVRFETESDLVGGAAYDAHGVAVTDQCVAKAKAADAVIFVAVGGPKWAGVPYAARPEAGLLRLRKDLGLFANLRPAICYPVCLPPLRRHGRIEKSERILQASVFTENIGSDIDVKGIVL